MCSHHDLNNPTSYESTNDMANAVPYMITFVWGARIDDWSPTCPARCMLVCVPFFEYPSHESIGPFPRMNLLLAVPQRTSGSRPPEKRLQHDYVVPVSLHTVCSPSHNSDESP